MTTGTRNYVQYQAPERAAKPIRSYVLSPNALRLLAYLQLTPGADNVQIEQALGWKKNVLDAAATNCESCGTLLYEEPVPGYLFRVKLFILRADSC